MGLFLLFVAFTPGRLIDSDPATRLAVTRQLWQHGSVFFPKRVPPMVGSVTRSPQGDTSVWGMGQSLVFVPFDMAGVLLGSFFTVDRKTRSAIELVPLVFFYGPLVGLGLWFSLVRLVKRAGYGEWLALITATAAVCTTLIFFYICQSIQEEAILAVILVLGLEACLRWTQKPSGSIAMQAGFLAGTAILFRINSCFALMAFPGIIADAVRNKKVLGHELKQAVLPVLLGMSGPLLLHFLFAYWRFGSAFSTGYDVYLLDWGGFHWEPFQLGVFGALLFGPSKGIFVLSPPLLLAVWGGVRFFRNHPFTVGAATLAFVGSVLFSSLIFDPDGSESWGVRYQAHMIGLFAVPLAEGLRFAKESLAARRVAVGLLSLGLVFQVLSCLGPTSLEYLQIRNGRKNLSLVLKASPRGQLYYRALNVFGISTPTQDKTASDYLKQTYVPNLWGAVLAKKIALIPVQWLVSVLWLFLAITSVGCFVFGFRGQRRLITQG